MEIYTYYEHKFPMWKRWKVRKAIHAGRIFFSLSYLVILKWRWKNENPTENLFPSIIRKFPLTRFHIIHLQYFTLQAVPPDDRMNKARGKITEKVVADFKSVGKFVRNTLTLKFLLPRNESFYYTTLTLKELKITPRNLHEIEIWTVRAANLNSLLIVLLNHSRNLWTWTTSVFKSWRSIVFSKRQKKLNKIFLYVCFLFRKKEEGWRWL